MRVEAAERLDDSLQAGLTDGGVLAADLHGAGDAKGVAHRSDGNAAFFEKRTEERIGDRLGQSERVAFAALHGKGESGLPGEVGGVDATREDDGVGLVGFTRFGGDTFNFITVCGELGNFSGDEFSSVGEDGFTEGFDKFSRREVAVLGPPDTAFGIDLSVGFELADAGNVADFGFESEGVSLFDDFRFFFEAGLGLAEHEEAFLDKREVFLFGEFDVETSAFEREVAEEFLGSLDVAFGGVLGEEPDPAGEGGGKAGAEEEGALGIEHPLEALRNDAGGGERDEVGGDDHTGVPFGTTARERVVTFDDADLVPGFSEVVGDSEADDSAADDEGFL